MEWGIDPHSWADVKAIAGCHSDCVEGVRGIGERRAAKYLRGELPADSTHFMAIWRNKSVWEHNLPLVKLPWPGVEEFHLEDDGDNEGEWRAVMRSLGMTSLLDRGRGRGFGFET
jgi:hypothetical protein